jgi:hypothetical protein
LNSNEDAGFGFLHKIISDKPLNTAMFSLGTGGILFCIDSKRHIFLYKGIRVIPSVGTIQRGLINPIEKEEEK